jgi:hypothetical protein
MSINANFPNVRPSLLLDFANSQQLDPRVTFSRSTTAPYYGTSSVLAEQNLALQSQSASFISGAQTGLTITGNTTVAPDGTTTGTTVAFAATTSYGYQSPSVGQILGTTYTYSVWVWTTTSKATISVRMANNSNGSDSTFSSVSLTTTPTRISVTRTFTNSGTSIDIGFDNRVAQGGDGIAGSIVYWGAQLEQRSSVTAYQPTTTSAITNYIPQLLTAPINAPRFDFNPTTGESLGLLIEQSSTNLLTYSQDFTNAVWTLTQGTIVANNNISPEGLQTASYFKEDTTTGGGKGLSRTYSLAIGTYTWTTYAKSSNRQLTISTTDQATGTSGATFNLVNGTVVGSVTQTGSWTNTIASIISVGNSWYRCQITSTKGASTSASTSYTIAPIGGYSYTGDGFSGVFLWNVQLENLAFSTSPIATTSAQVTRAADVDSMTGTNFSSWYNNGQGTFYTNVADSQTNSRAFTVDDGNSGSNQIDIAQDVSRIRVNAVDVGSFYTLISITGQRTIAYNNNQQSASNNGASLSSTTSSPVPPNMTTLRIGQSSSGSYLNGHIRKLAYYPLYLTTSQQQALTGS